MTFPVIYGLLKLPPAGGEWNDEKLSAVVKAFSTLRVWFVVYSFLVLDRLLIVTVYRK